MVYMYMSRNLFILMITVDLYIYCELISKS